MIFCIKRPVVRAQLYFAYTGTGAHAYKHNILHCTVRLINFKSTTKIQRYASDCCRSYCSYNIDNEQKYIMLCRYSSCAANESKTCK